MADDDNARGTPTYKAVPSGRLSRLGTFGRLASGIAGGMVAEGARRLANGERPRTEDMLLTPANAARFADRLSHLRGAAMKLGQMISMDAGDFLPPELADILARMRNQAYRMPPQQLDKLLRTEWGEGWRRRFAHFEAGPMAAASIGQVHRATLPDGRKVAIKVQYPGVRESIDADVDNVATLLKLSKLLPPELDIATLLDEAKRQLAEEADYEREGSQMQRFATLLANDDRYVVPDLVPEFTTSRVLAMSFIEGRPIETLNDADQETRNGAMASLIELVLAELFQFGVMQTDPNFANYRWQADSGKLVLLDFGATRDVVPQTQAAYRLMIKAGLAGDRDQMRETAVTAGFLGPDAAKVHRAAIDRIIAAVDGALGRDGPFDFADRAFVPTIRDEAKAMIADRATWHVPPVDTLFVQRKVSGTALLAARLQAKVDIKKLATDALLTGVR
jgi:predicted unusual protein kinase regulating ubiquinone biosynthesis (AarF/ABC1/UbiB family)